MFSRINIQIKIAIYFGIVASLIVLGYFLSQFAIKDRIEGQALQQRNLLAQARQLVWEVSSYTSLVKEEREKMIASELEKSAARLDQILLLLKQGGKLNVQGEERLLEPMPEELLFKLAEIEAIWYDTREDIKQVLNYSVGAGAILVTDNSLSGRAQLRLHMYGVSRSSSRLSTLISALEQHYGTILDQKSNFAKNLLNILIFANLIAITTGYFFVVKNTIKPIEELNGNLKKITEGELVHIDLDKHQHDEVGQTLSSLNQLSSSLAEMSDFATSVGNGNFNVEFAPRSKNDRLGIALVEMRNNLKKADEDDKNRNWANEGATMFAEILRTGSTDLNTISYEIISNLVKYLHANQGSLFIIRDENSEYLELTAAYAYEKRKYLEKTIRVGDGIAGQVVLEGSTTVMTEVPHNYVSITSGLGETTPSNLIIVPLKVNETVHGIIEIASFEEFTPAQITFTERVSESIASALANTKNNQRNEKLLEETQLYAEQMRAQEEEMRQNMEELMATQEEMGRIQAAMRQKENNLNSLINNSDAYILSIDRNYKILVINDAFKQYMARDGRTAETGANILEVVAEGRREIRKQQYDKALQGHSFTVIENQKGSDYSDNYYEITFNPILGAGKQVEGVSMFMRNITHLHPIRWETEI
jgi:PAS domain S-box-containing protein